MAVARQRTGRTAGAWIGGCRTFVPLVLERRSSVLPCGQWRRTCCISIRAATSPLHPSRVPISGKGGEVVVVLRVCPRIMFTEYCVQRYSRARTLRCSRSVGGRGGGGTYAASSALTCSGFWAALTPQPVPYAALTIHNPAPRARRGP